MNRATAPTATTPPTALRSIALIGALALLLSGCTGTPGGPGAAGASGEFGTPPKVDNGLTEADATTTWDVALQDDAMIVDFDAAAQLIEADVEAGRWVFPASVADSFDLTPGTTMLVAGVGLGTITDVATDGDTTTITTSQASLADVISDGEIGWDATLNMGEAWLDEAVTASGPTPSSGTTTTLASTALASTALASTTAPKLVGVELVNADGTASPASYEIVDGGFKFSHSAGGNDYVFQVTAQGQGAEIKVQVTRKTGSRLSMTYTAKGTIGAMKATGHAEYKGGELVSVDLGQQNLTGSIELSVAAAAAGTSEIAYTVPGFMFTWVLMVGPVPVTFGVTAQITGSVTAPEQASATFSSGFTFNGQTGISMVDRKVTVDADNFGSVTFSPDKADSGAFIGVPVDAQFGVAFPRLSVSVLGQGLVPFVEPGFILGTRLMWGPVCKTAYVKAVLVLGYDFTILGKSLASDKHTTVISERKTDQDGCSERHQ